MINNFYYLIVFLISSLSCASNDSNNGILPYITAFGDLSSPGIDAASRHYVSSSLIENMLNNRKVKAECRRRKSYPFLWQKYGIPFLFIGTPVLWLISHCGVMMRRRQFLPQVLSPLFKTVKQGAKYGMGVIPLYGAVQLAILGYTFLGSSIEEKEHIEKTMKLSFQQIKDDMSKHFILNSCLQSFFAAYYSKEDRSGRPLKEKEDLTNKQSRREISHGRKTRQVNFIGEGSRGDIQTNISSGNGNNFNYIGQGSNGNIQTNISGSGYNSNEIYQKGNGNRAINVFIPGGGNNVVRINSFLNYIDFAKGWRVFKGIISAVPLTLYILYRIIHKEEYLFEKKELYSFLEIKDTNSVSDMNQIALFLMKYKDLLIEESDSPIQYPLLDGERDEKKVYRLNKITEEEKAVQVIAYNSDLLHRFVNNSQKNKKLDDEKKESDVHEMSYGIGYLGIPENKKLEDGKKESKESNVHEMSYGIDYLGIPENKKLDDEKKESDVHEMSYGIGYLGIPVANIDEYGNNQ